MSTSVSTTFCKIPLSATSGLPYDLVLSRDWIFFYRETLPHTSFLLSYGIFRPVLPSDPLPWVHPTAQDLDPLPESSMIGPGDHTVDASIAPRPDRSACRVLCQDFESAADMAKVVLNIILDADGKHISTESLSHVAAALNLSMAGDRNRRFKLRSAIRKHTEAVTSAGVHIRSSASIAYFFNSFETHRKPVLLSIAGLHRIEVPEKSTIESLRSQITEHLLSGHCTQFTDSHPAITL
ncbi:hypothetical protein B0H14DRAFT_2572254 [Mycena olivaceomarginata]|nr:hypothetical protein B0H14DRAFT_2572254 [Mycena olivaceomarginata]